MEHDYIQLDAANIAAEHICCAFSDKKCAEGTRLKKEWLTGQFEKGFVFRRLDQRAKVFMEYCPAESAWMPVDAPGYLVVNCMWVSGSYQKKGHARNLLNMALEDARNQGRNGLVVVAGVKKMHFMTDQKWLLRNGFTLVDTLPDGFGLYVLKVDASAPDPRFSDSARRGTWNLPEGIAVYYSDRCPFTDYHVNTSLRESCGKRNIPVSIIKLDSLEQAQISPTPATIFSMYLNGKFVTTDLSACMDSRIDKFIG